MVGKCDYCGKAKKFLWVQEKIKTKGKYRCPNVKCEGHMRDKPQESTHSHYIVSDPRESSKWDNFGYRAGYLMEKAQKERQAAEEAAKGGQANPYNEIDDISGGMYEGEVK